MDLEKIVFYDLEIARLKEEASKLKQARESEMAQFKPDQLGVHEVTWGGRPFKVTVKAVIPKASLPDDEKLRILARLQEDAELTPEDALEELKRREDAGDPFLSVSTKEKKPRAPRRKAEKQELGVPAEAPVPSPAEPIMLA